MTPVTIVWNTRRPYTKHGQRIAASLTADGARIRFVDLDRNITGEIDTCDGALMLTPKNVLQAYDECAYRAPMLQDEAERAEFVRLTQCAKWQV